MKILTLSNYYPEHAGGIEFVALNLVRRWRERHTVRWLACETTRQPHRAAPDDVPLPCLNLAEERLGFPFPIPVPKTWPLIWRQVRWCDVLHLHDCLYATNLLAFWAARWYGKPVIITQHVGLVPYAQKYKNVLQSLAYNTLGKWVLQNAQQVVFISPRVQEWFEKHLRFSAPPLLLPNGIDRSLFYSAQNKAERQTIRARLGISAAETVLLFVGRFTEKKGLHRLQKVAQVRPAFTFLLIGSGELDPRGWNLPNVRVLPPQPQTALRSFYLAADLLLLPSQGEGFPLAVQEALACGLPAAVAKETAESLPDAPLLALEVTSIEKTIAAVETLLSQPKNLSARRSASSAYAQRWDWNNVAAAYEILFAQTRLTP